MSRWMVIALAAGAFACATSTPPSDKLGTAGVGAEVDPAAECRGPGRYEAGKEGSYRPCCAGLNEIFLQAAGYANDVPQCWSPPLRIYACIRGTCGDGICEEGEAAHCGCIADCPSAAWGPQDAGRGDASIDP